MKELNTWGTPLLRKFLAQSGADKGLFMMKSAIWSQKPVSLGALDTKYQPQD